MFIGHFAVGFAAKRWAPAAPLALLLAAPLLADILWPVLVLAGVEHATIVTGETPFLHLSLDDYPYSHSLAFGLVWAALLGGAWFARTKDTRAAVVLGIGVLSHWLLDWVTHRPDMPLWPGGPESGLGLWYSVPGTILVEGALYAAAVALYLRSTKAKDRIGVIAPWAMIVLLALAYAASAVSPPPPSLRPLLFIGIGWTAVLLVWAAWIDRHRENRQ